MSIRTNLSDTVIERRTILTEVDGEWVPLFTCEDDNAFISAMTALRQHISENTNEFHAKFRLETYRVQEVNITIALSPWDRKVLK
jgi:hypothetical protein